MPPLTRDKQFSLLGAAALWDAPVKGILEVYNRSLQENPLNVAYLCGDHRTLFFFFFIYSILFFVIHRGGKIYALETPHFNVWERFPSVEMARPFAWQSSTENMIFLPGRNNSIF